MTSGGNSFHGTGFCSAGLLLIKPVDSSIAENHAVNQSLHHFSEVPLSEFDHVRIKLDIYSLTITLHRFNRMCLQVKSINYDWAIPFFLFYNLYSSENPTSDGSNVSSPALSL